ncbi:MAG: lamin tail domain-containing protein [Bacteroidales bacterium]|nr:lamin tail domain-containing protein [Bacteroidales bacterium]MCF8397643.1 lamin tail domain-containing protein [Bacteroidales bacterium]
MKTKTFLLLLLIACTSAKAQFSDDFSDGDFSQNPAWTGDVSDFRINSDQRLQLYTEGAGASMLTTANNRLSGTEWRFWVKLSFSPSSNNNARIYLASDQKNLKEALNGYFIELGEAGSKDAIELFKQKGDDTLSICRGPAGMISSSFEIRIKVSCDDTGNWKIFADPSGTSNFILLAEGFDDEFHEAAYAGVFCNYTTSNSEKFYFDDFYAGDIQVDSIAPSISSLSVLNERSVLVEFDEGVPKDIVENPGNYSLSPGALTPVHVKQDDENAALVTLTFEQAFESETYYTLSAENIRDYAGNIAGILNAEFVFYVASPFEVVINEIMADPNPAVGLPEYEYLELHNTTVYDIDLNGWNLFIGNTEKEFSNIKIAAGGFLILADIDAKAELSTFGDFYGFSSMSLTNAGQDLVLRNKEGRLMSAVSYDDSWYEDPVKEDGGWALEQINPLNPCESESNWKVTRNLKGGTPGEENSVLNAVFTYPKISNVSIINPRTFEIFFDQVMDSLSLINAGAYEIDHDLGHPQSLYVSSDDISSVILIYENELEEGIIYELSIKDSLYNCAGHTLETEMTTRLGLPAKVGENDIVINEILFNPLGEGVDYVELYNRSGKILNLQELLIVSVKERYPNPPDTSTAMISLNNQLFFPDAYILLSEDPEMVKDQYFTDNPDAFLQLSGFPSFNKDKGKVILTDREGNTIDAMEYHENMHYEMLSFYDGVALERIHYDNPSHEKTNWHSASEEAGFGTPAYRNSQFVEEIKIKDPIHVEPEIFSPDNDGNDDVTNIHYAFDKSGFTGNITIYDADGNQVRDLVNNKLLGTNGFISWNGYGDNNEILPEGIYIIYFEVYRPDGRVKSYRKTTVLAKRL